jgi:hypothetical protein
MAASDESDDDSDINEEVPDIVQACMSGSRFKKPVKLSHMIEILHVRAMHAQHTPRSRSSHMAEECSAHASTHAIVFDMRDWVFSIMHRSEMRSSALRGVGAHTGVGDVRVC